MHKRTFLAARQNIVLGESTKALQKVIKLFPTDENLIMIGHRLSVNQKEFNRGIITPKKYHKVQNQVTLHFLNYLSDLEEFIGNN